MAASTNNIFDISKWKNGTTYKEHDIVKHNGVFWYSLKDNNQGNTPSINSTYWGGRKKDNVDGDNKPEFIWELSYNSSISHEPNTTRIQFGSGYSQIMGKDINIDLLNIDARLRVRSKQEAAAVLHFLHTRAGIEKFLFTPPPPYQKSKLFFAPTWSPNFIFFDNFEMRITMIELPR